MSLLIVTHRCRRVPGTLDDALTGLCAYCDRIARSEHLRSVVLKYNEIERRLTEALPELLPAAEHYWSDAGRDYLPYLFVWGVLAPYVNRLLAMPASTGRNRLLRRAFGFIEEMLSGDEDVVTLAFIQLFEDQPARWFRQAAEFLGPRALEELDACTPDWRELQNDFPILLISDPHGVRELIASELRAEGVKLDDVP